jgi:hypothetical protein
VAPPSLNVSDKLSHAALLGPFKVESFGDVRGFVLNVTGRNADVRN